MNKYYMVVYEDNKKQKVKEISVYRSKLNTIETLGYLKEKINPSIE